jgi:hypothetical protein
MITFSMILAATRARTTDCPAHTDCTIPAASHLFDHKTILRSLPYLVLPRVKQGPHYITLFNIDKIDLCNAVIFSSYQLLEEVKNFEEIKSSHKGFLLQSEKNSVLVWRTAKFTHPVINKTCFLSFSGETNLFDFTFTLFESCIIGTESAIVLSVFSDTKLHFHNYLDNIGNILLGS